MDVSKYSLDGAALVIVVDSERELEPFEFKVQPILESGLFGPASKLADSQTALAASAVIGWNFVDDAGPVACDEASKMRYLGRFANYIVKTANGVAPEKKMNLLSTIIVFALKPESFLKN